MVFDLFGRGYSDAPDDLPYDSRLYATQILLVLASSNLPWTTPAGVGAASSGGFHLVGYSLGGALCVAFARYFPHLLRSLALVASAGLIRSHHVGWQSRFLYNMGLLPEFLVRRLVRRRIRPSVTTTMTTTTSSTAAVEKQEEGGRKLPRLGQGAADDVDIVSAEVKKPGFLPIKDGDVNGGDDFNAAAISRSRPGVTVASIVRWQVDHHAGFIGAFVSTIRNAPIYAPQEDWGFLATVLARARRRAREAESEEGIAGIESPLLLSGLRAGKVLMVLGEDDPVIVKDEVEEDVRKVLGSEGVEFAVLPGGHEIPITSSHGVAEALEGFWRR
ncbi:Alpha/Beta hydrolase protein [Durotheca rogersii]|uniref:Alpha/Beta hydrolase protein n=1 Tax=Durotheca rogersii TaxID=419775 RepID=UPI002220A122|nr:Alpha/Beta hydrolase protein [Durotheca rogersii]KAI5866815.1 Alpha/Beta hydrolase protein [Durotheca rogersii]